MQQNGTAWVLKRIKSRPTSKTENKINTFLELAIIFDTFLKQAILVSSY